VRLRHSKTKAPSNSIYSPTAPNLRGHELRSGPAGKIKGTIRLDDAYLFGCGGPQLLLFITQLYSRTLTSNKYMLTAQPLHAPLTLSLLMKEAESQGRSSSST